MRFFCIDMAVRFIIKVGHSWLSGLKNIVLRCLMSLELFQFTLVVTKLLPCQVSIWSENTKQQISSSIKIFLWVVKLVKKTPYKSTTLLVRWISEQDKCTKAALLGCCTHNKYQKLLSESEIVKKVLRDPARFQEKKDDVVTIQGIAMSARRNTRRFEKSAANNKSSLLELLKKAPCYAIALTESFDIVDGEQISTFIRSLNI